MGIPHPKPVLRHQAISNAIHCAEEAHEHVFNNRPYPAQVWAEVAKSWTAIAELLPEVSELVDQGAETLDDRQKLSVQLKFNDQAAELDLLRPDSVVVAGKYWDRSAPRGGYCSRSFSEGKQFLPLTELIARGISQVSYNLGHDIVDEQ